MATTYKLKLKKGTKAIIRKPLQITIEGGKDYTQAQLKNWHDLGLTNYVSKSTKKVEPTE